MTGTEKAEGSVPLSRAEMVEILREIYAGRVSGDVASMMRHFSDDAHFELKGLQQTGDAALRCSSRQDVEAALRGLIGAVDFIDHEITSLVVEGEKVALQARFGVRPSQGGDVVITESADFLTFKGRRVASYIQYCDTALAKTML